MLRAEYVIEGSSSDRATKLYDLTLTYKGENQVLLRKFQCTWKYLKGNLLSTDKGTVLTPVAKYIIDLPIDIDKGSGTKEDIIYPPIAMPPGSEINPSIVTFRLQVHYSLTGRIDWHPTGDWGISFNIYIMDSNGDVTPLLLNEHFESNETFYWPDDNPNLFRPSSRKGK